MSSPTPNKGYTYPVHGGAVNAWDTPLNADFDAIDLNLGGMYPIIIGSSIVGVTYGSTALTASSTANVLTLPSTLAANLYYPVSGTLIQNLDIAFPAAGGIYSINNQSSGAFVLSIYPTGSSAGSVSVTQGAASFLVLNASAATDADGNKGRLPPQSNNTLVGNVSGASAVPGALTIGTGLTPGSSTSATISAPGFAPPSSFKNLVIKVLTNTTISVSADFVTTTDGTHYQTTAVNSTVNMGTTGVDALIGGSGADGTITAGTWYYLWVIVQSNGTTKVVAATESTANATFLANLANIASGIYTYYANIAAVPTASGVAQLMGLYQEGRWAQYILGLAQTTASSVIMRSGVTGAYSPTSPTGQSITVAGNGLLVPITASRITMNITNTWKFNSASNVLIAPNASWFGSQNGPGGSNGVVWPVYLQPGVGTNAQISMMLESTALVMCADTSGFAVACLGWEVNL